MHLTKRLLEKGMRIVSIDNISPYYDQRLKEDRLKILAAFKERFIFQKLDVADRDAIKSLVKKHRPALIVHLAAQAGVRYSLKEPFSYSHSNLEGFLSILEAARELSCPLVYASTSSVYGDSSKPTCSESDETDHPISLYAATKKANEVMAASYSHLFGFPTIGMRFFTVYGPWGRPDMALFKFASGLMNDRAIDVYNKGEMFRDFTYIDDIVDGIEAVIRHALALKGGVADIFNLGRGETRKLMDFINAIETTMKRKAKFNFLPMQAGDVVRTSANLSKSRQVLGFSPKISVEKGIENFVKWFREYSETRKNNPVEIP
jgi:UDP-glucuronate 4-epimerase